MRPSRAAVDAALRDARLAAYPPGQYIGQESFVTADQVDELAERAAIRADTSVIDICCGTGGIGRHVVHERRCDYVGVDRCPAAVDLAATRAAGLPCRFSVSDVPPIPAGDYQVALLIETLLAFRDKRGLLAAVAAALTPSGRFACTVEEGEPLTAAERARMPRPDTVWPVPLAEFRSLLAAAGLTITWCREVSAEQLRVVDGLVGAFTERRTRIAAEVGADVIGDLLVAHRLWAEWLRRGRIRKFSVVAEKG